MWEAALAITVGAVAAAPAARTDEELRVQVELEVAVSVEEVTSQYEGVSERAEGCSPLAAGFTESQLANRVVVAALHRRLSRHASALMAMHGLV